MDSNQLIFPMFAMVLLTFSVVARLFFARRKSVAEGKGERRILQGVPGWRRT